MAYAPSNNYDLDATRDDIITEALEICGQLAAGESPTANDLATCGRTLNYLIKHWAADGMQLWLRKEYTPTLTQGQLSYDFGPGSTDGVTERPLRILQAWRRTDTGEDIPLDIVSQGEYVTLSNKSQEGVITLVHYDPQWNVGKLYTWLTYNNNNDTLHLIGQKPTSDFDAATDSVEYPQEWYMPICWALAWAISTKYGVPPQMREEIARQATLYKQQALGFDTEEGTDLLIQPDHEFQGY